MPTEIKIKEICSPSFNLLIQNCCDEAIQEVITFATPGLPPIGSFVDDEGNCWSLLGTTTDPVNSVRIVSDPYGSCVTCLASNPCPDNLVVDSCCTTFDTIFSGSLPGVGVGDSFSDTFGFCWTVTGTTSAPINGIVSVDTLYPAQDCTLCASDIIRCPDIFVITSCCKDFCNITYFDLYTTLEQLGGGTPGETFVDQFGFCWTIGLLPEVNFTLLTGSFIQYVSSSNTDCLTCIAENNACEVNVFYTIQNCLTLETEVVQYLFGLPINYSFLISFTTDFSPRCYKIISWDNTSLPTKIIDAIEDCFIDCNSCLNQ
jgi:hypothetical protein